MNYWVLSVVLAFTLPYSQASCPSLANLTYSILGPFVGSGDHNGGADGLEALGGIDKLFQNKYATFFSELVDGGSVGWDELASDLNGGMSVGYRGVRFGDLMEALGFGARNFYSWAIADFEVPQPGVYIVQCGGIRNFQIDDKTMQGNVYALNSWWGRSNWVKMPIKLEAGIHRLRLKFRFRFQCQIICPVEGVPLIYPLKDEHPSPFNPAYVNRVPAVVDGVLSSPYISFPVVSAAESSVTSMDIKVEDIVDSDGKSLEATAEAGFVMTPHIQPGQILPLSIELGMPKITCPDGSTLKVIFTVSAEFSGGDSTAFTHELVLHCKSFSPDHPYTFTFLDFDGSIQIGVAKPPKKGCTSTSPQLLEHQGKSPLSSCAVILAFHGADVDASSIVWTGAIEPQDNAWVLFPSNRDKYGYDWEGIGRWDGLRCLETFAETLPGVAPELKEKYQVDRHRIIFTGHSMGGHGCLVFSTHYADWALGSVCAAAYISIEQYVDEYPGAQSGYEDPVLKGILSSASTDYHTDLTAVHLKGVPFMGRMGTDDTTVPPWHLRRFVRMLNQINQQPGIAVLSEVAGKKHWFGDVLNAPEVQRFYEKLLSGPKPDIPANFKVRSANLWSKGKGGVQILQFTSPSVSSWIDVSIQNGVWRFKTTNVRRFGLFDVPGLVLPSRTTVIIDGQELSTVGAEIGHYCRLDSPSQGGVWSVCKSSEWKLTEMSPDGFGPLRQVFHNKLSIVYSTVHDSSQMRRLAVEFANGLAVRGHAVVHIYSDIEAAKSSSAIDDGNIILLGVGHGAYGQHLIKQTTLANCCIIEETAFTMCGIQYSSPSTGFVALSRMKSGYHTSNDRPKLIAVVGGTDIKGLKLALSIMPSQPTAEIPDWVVVGEEFLWQGSGGFLAAGYFGNHWECRSDLSYPRLDTCGVSHAPHFAVSRPISTVA